jgi:hypothetical protein
LELLLLLNLGPSVAKDVEVTDTLDDGLVLQGSYDGVTAAGQVLTWTVGDMAPYSNKTLTITTKATKEGKLNNTVVVTTSTNESDKTNNNATNSTFVGQICDLVINKTVNASVINFESRLFLRTYLLLLTLVLVLLRLLLLTILWLMVLS